MEFIADILLISGATAAAFYCIVLSRRLKRFNDLEKGVGGAIAVLSSQVDDMTKTLQLAQNAALGSNESLEGLTGRAEDVAKRLEILVASMHDLPPVEQNDVAAAFRHDARMEQAEPNAPQFDQNGGFRSARSGSARVAA